MIEFLLDLFRAFGKALAFVVGVFAAFVLVLFCLFQWHQHPIGGSIAVVAGLLTGLTVSFYRGDM